MPSRPASEPQPPFPHRLDGDGRHDEEECYACALKEEVRNVCRCGECCRRLFIDVLLEDAEREPKIKERATPLIVPAKRTRSGKPEVAGYNLTPHGDPCVFLDRKTN